MKQDIPIPNKVIKLLYRNYILDNMILKHFSIWYKYMLYAFELWSNTDNYLKTQFT